MLCDLGAVPVVADALNPDQVAEAVARAKPEVIVHQLTAIGALDMRHFDRDFALTNLLRTRGTDYLLSAGQAVGVRRFVAQAVAGYGKYVRTGGAVKSGEGPARPDARARDAPDPGRDRPSGGGGTGRAVDGGDRAALRRVLGPGTSFTPGGE
jgi:nucleoside-diphosphate-sugar epimerase